MPSLREWITRLWWTFRPGRPDRELEQELRLHLELATEDEQRRADQAVGAQQRDVKRMFVASGLALTGIGIVIGLAVAVGVTQTMASLVFGISPLDPATYLAVPIVLLTAATLASYLPVRRMAAIDPVEALKAE